MFVAWALTVLGARIGWITIMVITVLVVAALVANPFLEALAYSFVVAGRSAFSVGDEIGFDIDRDRERYHVSPNGVVAIARGKDSPESRARNL